MTDADILNVLLGQKVYDGERWHVFDVYGGELTASSGVIWRAVPGALLMWNQPAVAVAAGATLMRRRGRR